MVLLLLVMRRELGSPLVAEVTVAAQFILFLAMPTAARPQKVLHG